MSRKPAAHPTAMTPKAERTIIAAAPGWYVAFHFYGDGREELQLEPVIGWAVTLDLIDGPDFSRPPRMYTKHEIEPLMLNGRSVYEDDLLWALKRPDGWFQLIESSSSGTEEDVME